jgi:hypothetical protein
MPLLSTSAQRAARQIIEACRQGDPELIITPAARLAVAMNGISPSFTQRMLAIAGWLMLPAGDAGTHDTRSGSQSVSRHMPTAVTRLADRPTVENNELPATD